MTNLTRERLAELLKYDPETGIFTRLTSPNNRVKIGDVAGNPRADGYIKIRVDFSMQYAHRLAWLYMTGEWPEHKIDHIDGNKSNNRWSNLRDVTGAVNMQNRYTSKSLSGEAGVSRDGSRWRASITTNGRSVWLGSYKEKWHASAAYLAAKVICHPEAFVCVGLEPDTSCISKAGIKNLRNAGLIV